MTVGVGAGVEGDHDIVCVDKLLSMFSFVRKVRKDRKRPENPVGVIGIFGDSLGSICMQKVPIGEYDHLTLPIF